MRRLSALLLVLALAGCSRGAKAPAQGTNVNVPPAPAPAHSEPATPPSPPPATPAQPVGSLPERSQSLDALKADLTRYLNEGNTTVSDKLQVLVDAWKLQTTLPYVEADLAGLGRKQFVFAVSGYVAQGPSYGAILVIDNREGRWAVDVAPTAYEGMDGAQLLGVKDLTGDGKPEIVWYTTEHGAHTSFGHVHVVSWAPGRWTELPGKMDISMPRLSLDGDTIVLQGGSVGSAGAGMAQRDRIDRYAWRNGEFRLTGRQYLPSPFAYHRAQDGVVAEGFQRWEEARKAYEEALQPDREVLPPDYTAPEWQARLNDAVRAFARFRLGLLLMKQGAAPDARAVLGAATGPYAGLSQALLKAGEPGAGCTAANAWASQNGEFLQALNSPFGYATPHWKELCATELPPGE